MLLSNLNFNYWNRKCYSKERPGVIRTGVDFWGKVIGWEKDL